MSPASADAAIGMMDSAYFVSRKELLDFFNNLLNLRLTKIEQTASGAIACQLTELIFPGSIALQKINWQARTDYEFVQNYKLLQVAFAKHHVQKYVDVDKLIRAKYQDNLEFCQWLKAFFEGSHVAVPDDYDPAAVRAKGKGGAQYNSSPLGGVSGGRSGVSSSTMNRASALRPGRGISGGISGRAGRATTSTSSPSFTASRGSPSKPLTSRTALTSSPSSSLSRTTMRTGISTATANNSTNNRQAAKSSISNPSGNDASSNANEVQNTIDELREQLQEALDLHESAQSQLSQAQSGQADLENKIVDMENAVGDIEKERDFYFEKLRHVEVLLQVYQESSSEDKDPDRLVEDVFKILYATAEENVVVNDEGHVVELNTSNEGSNANGADQHDHDNNNDIENSRSKSFEEAEDDDLFNDDDAKLTT